ncbi:MAG: hypothetical protein WC220_14615 [Pedobacter sp.]|jgi:hypothetical protein
MKKLIITFGLTGAFVILLFVANYHDVLAYIQTSIGNIHSEGDIQAGDSSGFFSREYNQSSSGIITHTNGTINFGSADESESSGADNWAVEVNSGAIVDPAGYKYFWDKFPSPISELNHNLNGPNINSCQPLETGGDLFVCKIRANDGHNANLIKPGGGDIVFPSGKYVLFGPSYEDGNIYINSNIVYDDPDNTLVIFISNVNIYINEGVTQANGIFIANNRIHFINPTLIPKTINGMLMAGDDILLSSSSVNPIDTINFEPKFLRLIPNQFKNVSLGIKKEVKP